LRPARVGLKPVCTAFYTAFEDAGITLWMLWETAAPTVLLQENAHVTELPSPQAPALVGIEAFDLGQLLEERVLEEARGGVVVRVRALTGLRDDRVHDAEVDAVQGVGPEGGRGLLGLAGVSPEDGRTPLGRDDGVDRVLLHQHAVGYRDGDRSA
jgi:hypothetical protein